MVQTFHLYKLALCNSNQGPCGQLAASELTIRNGLLYIWTPMIWLTKYFCLEHTWQVWEMVKREDFLRMHRVSRLTLPAQRHHLHRGITCTAASPAPRHHLHRGITCLQLYIRWWCYVSIHVFKTKMLILNSNTWNITLELMMIFSTIAFYYECCKSRRKRERVSGVGGNSKSGRISVIPWHCHVWLSVKLDKFGTIFWCNSFTAI